MNKSLECIFKDICRLGEGPVWNIEEQKLYWTDILARRLWVYDPVENISRLFWEGSYHVGGFAFTQLGGVVLCTDKGIQILHPKQLGQVDAEPETLFDIKMAPEERFNDIIVDPAGRIFAGTLNISGSKGILYRVEKGKEPVPVLTGIGCSNGMSFSMDQKIFFHTDSRLRRITRYAYDLSTGEISDPELFFQGTESQGTPDGITLDIEDHIWAAFWGGSAVRRLDPEGRVVEEISLPVKQPSSVMFGGRDLQDLYITSACQGARDFDRGVDEQGVFLGGPVYRIRTEVGGRPEWLADFD